MPAKAKAGPIGPAEALELLESALGYCRQAGLLVQAGNAGGKLALLIDGAQVERSGDGLRFVVAGTPETGNVPAIVPAIEPP